MHINLNKGDLNKGGYKHTENLRKHIKKHIKDTTRTIQIQRAM